MKTLHDYITRYHKAFEARWFEGGQHQHESFSLNMKIPDTAYEWQYAVIEILNQLNALEVGQTMRFHGVRGDESTVGYIVRVE